MKDSAIPMPIVAPLLWFVFLVVYTCLLTVPMFFVLFLLRRRISRNLGRSTAAACLAGTAIYLLVSSEFANSLYGVPDNQKLLIHLGCLGAHAAIGWLIGGAVVAGMPKQARQ